MFQLYVFFALSILVCLLGFVLSERVAFDKAVHKATFKHEKMPKALTRRYYLARGLMLTGAFFSGVFIVLIF